MVTGFITDSNGNTRHFDETTGLMTRGWLTDAQMNINIIFTAVPALWPKGWVENKKEQKRYFSQSTMDVCVQAG